MFAAFYIHYRLALLWLAAHQLPAEDRSLLLATALGAIEAISRRHASVAAMDTGARRTASDGVTDGVPVSAAREPSSYAGRLAASAALAAAAEQLLCSASGEPPVWAAERLGALLKVHTLALSGYISTPKPQMGVMDSAPTMI